MKIHTVPDINIELFINLYHEIKIKFIMFFFHLLNNIDKKSINRFFSSFLDSPTFRKKKYGFLTTNLHNLPKNSKRIPHFYVLIQIHILL